MKQTQVLKRPVITEKSLMAATFGQYTFEVDTQAKKPEIARAIEKAFGVHVKSLKTINLKGKKRRFGRRRAEIALPDKAKAIAKLAQGEKIDLFSVPGQEEVKK